jgi:hypothetical protein
VDVLKDVPVLLNKSQLPRVKERKPEAGQLMITEFQKKDWIKNDEKTKTDAKKTGNKPIVLSDWGKDLLGLIDSDSNPSFSCVPGTIYSSP